jgi:hypothetical protein
MKAPDTHVIRDAVSLACQAPSLHESQPWRWVSEGAALRLWADHYRVVYATDHGGREPTLNCGAVLDHLRVAVIRQVTGTAGQPQRLIRVGKLSALDPQVKGTARRPLTEVLEIR